MSNNDYETRDDFNGVEVHITGGTHYVVLSLEEATADAESGSGYAVVLLDAEQSAEIRYALELAESAIDPDASYDEVSPYTVEEENVLLRQTVDQLDEEVGSLRALIGAMAEGGKPWPAPCTIEGCEHCYREDVSS